MKLIVFGATGNCGRHVVKLAAARGHSVTAVVRDGRRADAPATVTVVRGNVLDPSFVASALRGQDAVMSGLGMRYRHPWSARESPDDFISRATTHIVDGMRAAGVARISAISAGGIGDSRPVLNLLVRFLVATSNVGVAYADLERVVMSVPGVLGCHHIRTRGSTDHVFLDLHVWLPPAMPLTDAHALSHVVKDRLMARYPQIADAVIHIEPPPPSA